MVDKTRNNDGNTDDGNTDRTVDRVVGVPKAASQHVARVRS